MALTQMGRLEESGRELDHGLDLASKRGEPVATGLMHDGFVARAYFTGEKSGILEHAQAAVELGEQSGIELIRGIGGVDCGIAHFVREEWDAAATALRSWLVDRPGGILPAFHPVCLAVLARAMARGQKPGEAIPIAEEAVRVARDAGMAFVSGLAELALGETLRFAHGSDAGRLISAAHDAALASVGRTQGRALLPLIRWDQAELAAAMADDQERRLKLGEALELAEIMGATGYAERLSGVLGGVS